MAWLSRAMPGDAVIEAAWRSQCQRRRGSRPDEAVENHGNRATPRRHRRPGDGRELTPACSAQRVQRGDAAYAFQHIAHH